MTTWSWTNNTLGSGNTWYLTGSNNNPNTIRITSNVLGPLNMGLNVPPPETRQSCGCIFRGVVIQVKCLIHDTYIIEEIP